jgi:hypothetical protein
MEEEKNSPWKFYKPKFEFKKDLKRSAWTGHSFFAYDLIANSKPNTLVELGTHRGNSLFAFAQAVKDFNLNTELNAVDIWYGDDHSGYYSKNIYEHLLKIKEKFFKGVNIKTHKMYFHEALEKFEDNSIDILHIDGLHTYEAVKEDFLSWLPKVNKKKGVILFHDICIKKKGFGVYKLWEELEEDYNTVYFKQFYGLGVVIFDEDLYKKISKKGTLKKARRSYYLRSIIPYILFMWEAILGLFIKEK